MPSLFTIILKAKKQLLLAILGIMIFSSGFAQVTLSPYSRYGLGEPISANSARFSAMGGIGIGSYGLATINRVNPASYADIRLTTLDLSANGGFRFQDDGTNTRRIFTAGINNFAFAFPANKHFTLVAGLAPFSATGYALRTQDTLTVDTVPEPYRTNYTGNGGLNQFYLGIAGSFLREKIKVGANLGYAFGTNTYSWESIFENTGYSEVNVDESIFMRGFVPRIGVQYEDTLRIKRKVDQVKDLENKRQLFVDELNNLKKELQKLETQAQKLDYQDAFTLQKRQAIQKEQDAIREKIKALKENGATEREINKLEKKDFSLGRKRKRIEVKMKTSIRKISDQTRFIDRKIAQREKEIGKIDARMEIVKNDSSERYIYRTEKLQFRVGGVFDPPLSIRGERAKETTNGIVGSTLQSDTGKILLPMNYGFGVSIGKPGYWMVGADVSFQNWAAFKFFDETNTLKNSYKIAVGGEITPRRFARQFYKRVSWRVGGYFQNSPVSFGGGAVAEGGATFGVGLPLGVPERSTKLFSRINMGIKVGRIFAPSSGLLDETTVQFSLGVNLNDRWFVKRRVD